MLQIQHSAPSQITTESLRLEAVSLQFSKTLPPTLVDISLTLATGELLALLGPSGCGKTSLLRSIAGFLTPQSGHIVIADRTVFGPRQWIPPERRHVGMVFQDYALFPHLTVLQNIAFGLQSKSGSRSRISPFHCQRVEALLDLVGLDGYSNRFPHELSGGQQQRVALARALAPQPPLVLLDEPLSNLDSQIRLRLREQVQDILKLTGTAGIFVTHDQQEALAIADRVAVMQQGRLEQIGTPEEVYRHPASRFVAKFVTQANCLPAQRRGSGWVTEVGYFEVLPSQIIASDQVPTSNCAGELMIREEDWRLQPCASASVMVKARRFLGREYRYRLETRSGQPLYARTPADTDLKVGTPVQLSAHPAAISLFLEQSQRLKQPFFPNQKREVDEGVSTTPVL
jgi:iron(III) transport system ATP-binding protein